MAAGNVGGAAERAAVERYADGDDPLLREHAAWALARIDERARSMGASVKLIRTLSVVRVAIVPLTLAMLLLDRGDFPPGYETAAWWLLAVQALVALALLALAWSWQGRRRRLAVLNVAADFALVGALLLIYAWDPGQPLRTLPYLVVLEAALFFRLLGGVVAAALTLPLIAMVESFRESEFGTPAEVDSIVLRWLIALALGGVVGRLVEMERGQARAARERAIEAERFRDELGRRIDMQEATSRAARALGSSLDLDVAFAAFVQELRGLAAVRPRRHPPRRGKPRRRDGDRRNRRGGVSRPRHVRSRSTTRSSSW